MRNSPSVHSSGQHSGWLTSSVDETVLEALLVVISVAFVCSLASEVLLVGWFASVVFPLMIVASSVTVFPSGKGNTFNVQVEIRSR